MVSLHELGTPISQDELRRLLDDPRKPLASLQGNILKGHGRDNSVLIFLRFKAGKLADVENWIRKFSERVTSAQQQFCDAEQHHQSSGPGPLFTNFFLSAKGYEHLFPNIRIRTRFNDKAFLYGMRAAQYRLNDPPVERFEQGLQHTIDAMVLLAHNEESSLRQEAASLASAIQAHTEICVVEHGRVMRNEQHKPREHFGFVDSSSQPLFFEKDVEQAMQKHQASHWNPSAGPNLVLVPDPFGRRECDCGSYMVFRKLEQNVRGFKTRERQLANALGLVGAEAKRAGALIMGRFKDGTPLALHSTDGKPDENDFAYDDDPDGGRCPIQAHIRKANPRQAWTPRIVRRGVSYGEGAKEPKDNSSDDEWPSEGVGLLFMCYQRSIVQQFEVLQYLWANDPRLPWEHSPGIDPVIGQAIGNGVGQHTWPVQWNDPREKHKPFSFHGYVTLKGGEYFFAPSIYSLRNL